MVSARHEFKLIREAYPNLKWKRDRKRDSDSNLCAPITLWATLGSGVRLHYIDGNYVVVDVQFPPRTVPREAVIIGESGVRSRGVAHLGFTDEQWVRAIRRAVDRALLQAERRLDRIGHALSSP
jgi:hypothetical protein